MGLLVLVDNKIISVTLIIIGVIFVVCLIIFLLVYPFYKRKNDVKTFHSKYYKRIRKLADLKDYYLLNNLTLTNAGQTICRIDHILFGEKYIYVIKDRYYRGAINGAKDDFAWFFYSKKAKEEMDNPMMMNEKRVEKLSLITQIDKSFFISIVLVNDDCVVKNMQNLNSESSYIVASSKLGKLIKVIESRDVKKMDDNQLKYAVSDISNLYGKDASKKDEEASDE